MSVKMRQLVEQRIAEAVIDAALAAGYSISVNNGGDEDELTRSTNKAAILAAMFQTDEEHLNMYKQGFYGWVFFVYGNDGYDVVSDYTCNLEPIMTEANRLADYYGS